jgi:AGCS family alanine or glycine:cation symporter
MTIIEIVSQIEAWVWGEFMLIMILGVGLWLTLRTKAISIRRIPYAFGQLLRGRAGDGEGDIAPFSALMLSLSATIGTGNIVGVATAIGLGGPGALFWMWCSALVGMATKYSEAVCAVNFRETNAQGQHVGGPMYYIRNGLGSRWAWLGICFALFGALAGFGIGNTVQANSVADALQDSFGISEKVTAVALAVLTGLVLIGGVQRIAAVARKLVPIMAIAYLAVGLIVIFAHVSELPAAFVLIVKSAFTPVAAQGGFAGAAVGMAIQMGISRGVFSNEAGLGSAPIAHAAAATNSPVRQGTIAMLGTLIDTLVICSITGLAIVVTGAWTGDVQGAVMSHAAFESIIPQGDKVVSVALAVFAFTTLLGWSYYGERCTEFLLGSWSQVPFRVLWIIAIPFGALGSLDLVWKLASILNGLMAIPNLIALLALSGVVAKLTRDYFQRDDGISSVQRQIK